MATPTDQEPVVQPASKPQDKPAPKAEVPTPPSAVETVKDMGTAVPPLSAQAAAAPPPPAPAPRTTAAVPQGNVEPDTIVQDPFVDLTELVNVGRIEDTLTIFGYRIRMHTLRADENTEALAAVAHMGDTAGANALMVQVLSRAIDTINGVALEEIYQGSQKSRVARRVELVQAFQQTFLTRLWEQYTQLMDRSNTIAEEADGPLKNL